MRGGRLCVPLPYDFAAKGFRLPLDPRYAHEVGRGMFRGRQIDPGTEALVNGRPPKSQSELVGFDARTHEPFVHRRLARGHVYAQELITSRPHLPARDVSFAVPEGGAPQRAFPPVPQVFTQPHGSGLRAIRKALGQSSFWLGPSFQGHPLRSAHIGTYGITLATGRKAQPVRFARFDYGIVSVQVFDGHPFWWTEGPSSGQMVLEGRGLLDRDGHFIVIEGRPDYLIDRGHGLAVERALRPIPPA